MPKRTRKKAPAKRRTKTAPPASGRGEDLPVFLGWVSAKPVGKTSRAEEPILAKPWELRDPPYKESWPDFFNRLRESGGSPLSATDVKRLIRFWKTWPGRWAEICTRQGAELYDAVIVLEVQQNLATRLLMAEAERRGMNSGSLDISAKVCARTIIKHPALGRWPSPEIATWPECLEGAGNPTIRPDQEAALSEAQALLARLDVVIAAPDQGSGTRPKDLITGPVARATYKLSRGTMRRAILDGRLTDWRPENKRGTKSPVLLSREEVSGQFPLR